jgi:hypothetical protein
MKRLDKIRNGNNEDDSDYIIELVHKQYGPASEVKGFASGNVFVDYLRQITICEVVCAGKLESRVRFGPLCIVVDVGEWHDYF